MLDTVDVVPLARGPTMLLVGEEGSTFLRAVVPLLLEQEKTAEQYPLRIVGVATSPEEMDKGVHEKHPDLILLAPPPNGCNEWLDAAARLHGELAIPFIFRGAVGERRALIEGGVQLLGFLPDDLSDSETEIVLGVIMERFRDWKEIDTRRRQQQAVAELGLEALANRELQQVMQRAVELVSVTLGNELVKVLELLPEGRELLLKAGVGWRPGLVGTARVGTGKDSQAGYTLMSSTPVVVQDLRRETRFKGPPLLVEHGVMSGMSVVIHTNSGHYGVLGTHTKKLRIFSRDDVNFLQSVANVLGMAIDRWRTEEVIGALSTPVLPIGDRLLLMPLIGALDFERVTKFREVLLSAIQQYRARAVVLDFTGVAQFDAAVTDYLSSTIKAAGLLGAQVVMSGLSPKVAQAILAFSERFTEVTMLVDLSTAVGAAQGLPKASARK